MFRHQACRAKFSIQLCSGHLGASFNSITMVSHCVAPRRWSSGLPPQLRQDNRSIDKVRDGKTGEGTALLLSPTSTTPRGASRRQNCRKRHLMDWGFEADPTVEDLIWGSADCMRLPVLSCGVNVPRDNKAIPLIGERGLLRAGSILSRSERYSEMSVCSQSSARADQSPVLAETSLFYGQV